MNKYSDSKGGYDRCGTIWNDLMSVIVEIGGYFMSASVWIDMLFLQWAEITNE